MELENLVKHFKAEEEVNCAPDALLEFMQQIQNFFAGSIEPSKLDSYLGITFPESEIEGLYGFLRRKITEKKYDKVKEHAFNLMQFILVQKTWRGDVVRFYLNFKIVADMYWKQSKESARMQQAALDCLISLFENYGHTLDQADFGLAQLYWELLPRSEKSSYQPTVRGKMFHLMGILGALGNNVFMSAEDETFKQLFNHLLSSVRAQVESTDSHLEVSILYGCMKGLDRLLNTYGEEIRLEDPSWVQFEEHLEQIINPSCSIVKGNAAAKIKRREFQRAALELVANHGELLKGRLIKRYKQWFEDLILWSKSPNADDNRIGRRAMYNFLDTVMKHGRQENQDSFEIFFAFFAERFKGILSMNDANRIELGIAVRGYGMLAGLCSEESQSLEMLDLMMGHVNGIIQELDNTKIDKYSGSATLYILPTYLESVASILSSLESENETVKFPETHLDSIKKLTISIIRYFPDMSDSQRNFCHISVEKLFDSLWSHHHVLCEPFIEQVYHQSFLHIISCPTRAEIDILVESWKKSNPDSKKSALNQLGLKPVLLYVRFWKLLLRTRDTELKACDELKFDLLMKWVLTTINKLDLNINFEENDTSEAALDPMQGASASVVKDFQIFVNIVDFFQNLITSSGWNLQRKFEKWIPIFSVEMLSYINTHPFVSGFYKIFAVIFDVARSVKYFDLEHDDEGIRKDLQRKLNIFFRKLGTKIREYRDDLLFAVLELWLSLPDAIILTNFTALNQTLQTVFTTGKDSFSLAIKGLEAIERWFFQPKFPVEGIKIIMNSIYPILKSYFMHSELSDEENMSKKKPELNKGGLKVLIKKNIQSSQSMGDPTLKSTQMKILQVLGSFGQYLDIGIQQHSGLSKDQRFLQYSVPFQDSRPEFYIDDLLPRVLELCENSVERQTRISACEFFHTICLMFIGNSRDRYNERLCKVIFEAMLKLGCDSDITVRQLFNPLCLQTIHWFTKRHSPYGSILLEALTNALAQYDDLALREFAAICIGEFFSWSLKHNSESGKNVLQTIFAMSTHASPDYRQGSVLAFNSIYREFREEHNLVAAFTFNLLYSFLTSLKLSKNLPDDSLLIRSTKQSIKHLERIIYKKKVSFNTALNTHQFKPMTSVDKTSIPKLQNVVDWLLSQGGNEASVYREECLRLVELLSTYVDGYKTPERCLTSWEEKNGRDGWISIAEQSLKSTSFDTVSFLCASVSFYSFLHKNEVLTRSIILNSKSRFCPILMDVCEANEYSDETKIRLLEIFSKLEFGWMILDEDNLIKLWSFALELSKENFSLIDGNVLLSLGKVINSGTIPEILKERCSTLLLFDPIQNWTSARDQSSKFLNESEWYRIMAEQGLISAMISTEHCNKLKEKLMASINTALFKQLSTASGSTWEANVLNLNERKVLENYFVTAICVGVDQASIVELVFDATNIEYYDGSFQLSGSKGQVFQKQLLKTLVYCDSLFDFDILLRERPIVEVGELIQRFLELLKLEKSHRKKFGDKIFQKTLDHWRMISINCEVQTTVKIFTGLIAVDIDACKSSAVLVDWWSGPNLLQARHLDLKQKASVFGYISVFSMSRNKKIIETLIKTVSSLAKELNPNEISWADVEQYVSHTFRKVLITLELLPTQFALLDSVLLLTQKVSTWVNHCDEHYLFRAVRNSLEKVVKAQTADADRVGMVSHIYEAITKDSNKTFVETMQVWKTCLLPAVSALNLNATKIFFKKFIYDIITKVGIKPNCLYDLCLKILEVNLLELMVYQTSSDFIKGEELAAAYWRNASTEEKTRAEQESQDAKTKIVHRGIVRVFLDGVARGGPIPSEDSDLRKSTFAFNEACYNTVVAQLLVTNSEFRFFDKFLFPGKKIFESLMDPSVVYEFPVVIDEDSHKSGIVSHWKKSTRGDVTDSRASQTALVHLLSGSQNLSGSSLAPEATTYDFTTSVTVADCEFYQRIFATNPSENGETGVSKENAKEDIILEWNEINQHSCMYAFVEVLRQMGEFNSKKADEGRQWSKTLAAILLDNKVHKNVKTFIVGGILNTPESMKPFAAELIEPIVQLILTDCFGSVKLNHFVQDVLLTLLSWYKTSKPLSESVTSVIKYILCGMRTEAIASRKDITSYILEILQNVIKYWVTDIREIPSQEVFGLGIVSNPTEERSLLMLEVCLQILQGGQLPQTERNDTLRMLKKALSSPLKSVFKTAAKCLGLLLKRMKGEAPDDVFEQNLGSVLTKIINFKTKPPKFIIVISTIQKVFPEIMARVHDSIFELCQQQKLRAELVTLLPLLFQQRLNENTSSLSLRQKCGDEFFIDADGRNLFQNPCTNEQELHAALALLELLINNCSCRLKLLKMVDWVARAETSPNIKIKLKFVTCLHSLYREIMNDATQVDSEAMEATKKRLFLQIFIRMFNDEDEDIREAVSKFWKDVLSEWDQTSDLLLEIFDLIGQEENPLNVCLGLILQRCILAPDYRKNIFPYPLEDIQFLPFQLDTSWRLRNSSFQPLFAESLSSMKNFGTLPRPLQSTLLSQRRSVGKFGMNVLRATLANLQFTPTLERDGGNETLDSEMMMQIDEYSNMQLQSPFIMNTANEESIEGSGNENSDGTEGKGNPILKLRKKFYAKKDSTFYATKTAEKKNERLEEAEEMEKVRISGVKTVRSYRIGELPDIQIQHADVLQTLLKLAKLDLTIGQQFVHYLYQGFIREKDPSSGKRYREKSVDTFDRVLRNTITSSDHSLSTLLIEICVHHSISLHLNTLLDICKITNSQKLGILKLEQELLNETDSTASSSKRARIPKPKSSEEHIWLGLAEMYKEIEEYDALRNMFRISLCNAGATDERQLVYEKIGEALYHEGLGELEKSLSLYDEALDFQNENEGSSNTTSKLFLEDAMMHCLSKLGSWSELYTFIEGKSLSSDEDFLHVKSCIEHFIPMRIMSGMHLLLREIEDDESIEKFNAFMEKNLRTEEGTNFFSEHYPFDLGMWLLAVDENEYHTQASLVLERGFDSVLRCMKDMNARPVKQQKKIMISLQQGTVMSDYLQWKKHARDNNDLRFIEEKTKFLIGKWRKHLAYHSLDLIGNDRIAAHRDCFSSKMGIFLQEKDSPGEVLQTIQEMRVEQELWLAELGVIGKNHAIAKNCLLRVKNAELEDIKFLEFRKTMAKTLAVFSKQYGWEQWNRGWSSVWKKLSRTDEDAEVRCIKADLLYSLVETVVEQGGDTSHILPAMKTLTGQTDSNLSESILTRAEELMRSSHSEAPDPSSATLYAKLFLLIKTLADVLMISSPAHELAEKMLCCVLRGCTGGSPNDMLLLSNIFSLLKKFPDNLNVLFADMAKIVPGYMFLPWLDQIMTAYKYSPLTYPSFKPLIERLVAEYPQALQLQYSEYLNEGCQLFAKALQALVLPAKFHENRVNDILSCGTEEGIVEHLNGFQTVLQEILNNTSKLYGEKHRQYATEMFKTVSKLAAHVERSSQGSNSHMSAEEFVRQAHKDVRETSTSFDEKDKRDMLKKNIELKSLSPFLAEFHFFDFAALERPGLYESFKRPKVQDHPLIVSFHPTVQIFRSLTRPIKFTLITNDGKTCNFLAKLGDDLRQDRRIQQLFKMSNVLFQQDASISQRNLSVETYSCIPTTADFGIIEMVENVMSMVEMVFDTAEREKDRALLSILYDKWLRSSCEPQLRNLDSRYDIQRYRSSAKLIGRQQAEGFFDDISSRLPKFLLRDNICKRARNVQEFFSVRQTMIKSYGALCMVHWLLGIGDRHLENTLISLTLGKVVGIDFGRAFGTSNYVIPVPELVPFRLTPQFQQLMMPYSFKGLFRESCILTWNCLMNAQETILTVADVFIQEPSLDWQKLRKGSKTGRETEDSNDSNLAESTDSHLEEPFPFSIMKKKLQRYNPTRLLIEELKMHSRKDIPSIYCSIAENGRIHLEKERLSTEEYIDVLLDLATDKNILIRIFKGWNSWV